MCSAVTHTHRYIRRWVCLCFEFFFHVCLRLCVCVSIYCICVCLWELLCVCAYTRIQCVLLLLLRTCIPRVCVWRCVCMCVCPTSASLKRVCVWLSLCLCSLLHPTRHSCLLFMGTGTAGHPSRAFSQWDNHNIWAWCHTLTHTRTHMHRKAHTVCRDTHSPGYC